MTKINHLEMAPTVCALPQIDIKKSFFGLKTLVTYLPTHSSVQVIQNEYSAADGAKLESILKAKPDAAVALLNQTQIEKASMGNMRLDACVSADNQFVALQLLRFIDFDYKPVTSVMVFEGKDAEAYAEFCKR